MFITSVLVCGYSRDEVEAKFQPYIDRIGNILSGMTFDFVMRSGPRAADRSEIDGMKIKFSWEKLAIENGWRPCSLIEDGQLVKIQHARMLGVCAEKVTCNFNTSRDALNRWLYNASPMAFKQGYVDLPILILPVKGVIDDVTRPFMAQRANFETVLGEFKDLEPISHSHPFMIFGASFESAPQGVSWYELSKEKRAGENKVVINRSIEFPPEFRQAGLGILNYFGEVVREKYPNEHAKIRIEQDGLTVRMIVEAEDGSRDVIEKALAEYELVITGQKPPEFLFDDRAKVLELRNELRIAQTRIESQKDLLEYQKQDIKDLKQLFGMALSSSVKPEINLTVSPCITISSNQSVSQNVSYHLEEVLEDVQSLMEGADPEMSMRLNDLSDAVESVTDIKSPEDVKASTGLTKLKKFLDEASESGSKVQKLISSVSDGVEVLRGLAKKYNAVAEWCGAPQVPRILVD